jgi:hypothetical protein
MRSATLNDGAELRKATFALALMNVSSSLTHVVTSKAEPIAPVLIDVSGSARLS